jgi:hypothetical protein
MENAQTFADTKLRRLLAAESREMDTFRMMRRTAFRSRFEVTACVLRGHVMVMIAFVGLKLVDAYVASRVVHVLPWSLEPARTNRSGWPSWTPDTPYANEGTIVYVLGA